MRHTCENITFARFATRAVNIRAILRYTAKIQLTDRRPRSGSRKSVHHPHRLVGRCGNTDTWEPDWWSHLVIETRRTFNLRPTTWSDTVGVTKGGSRIFIGGGANPLGGGTNIIFFRNFQKKNEIKNILGHREARNGIYQW